MNNNIRDIKHLKLHVKNLIQKNSHREVTPKTKYKVSGIYMIYIGDFTHDYIVPIYVGQSKNIQNRYKQHLCEILALNRLSFDEYKSYFYSKRYSFYEGTFKTSKIFKYMIDNQCSLQDFHMVILDEVGSDKLEEMEQEYFKMLLPSFFGFNQFNSFLASRKMRFSNLKQNNEEINEYLNLLMVDIEGIYAYYQYGFTKFNLEHSIPRDISFLLRDREQFDSETQLRFKKTKSSLRDLQARYMPDLDKKIKLDKKREGLYDDLKATKDKVYEEVNKLKININKEFKELKLYSEKGNCQSNIKYFEQDFYNLTAMKPERFKITSMLNSQQDNSFISILAEYKHGINDYFIRQQTLVRLAFVISEIQTLIDTETRFKINVSESHSCLEKCMINEGLFSEFLEENILLKKLPGLKKRRKSKANSKNVANKNDKIIKSNIRDKINRADRYTAKVKERSNSNIMVVSYVSSKEKVTAKCNICSYEWKIRSDHLLARPYCPACKK